MKKKCRYGNRFLASGFRLLASCYWLVAIASFSSCSEKSARPDAGSQQPEAVYFCPMHPEVQQDIPGKCPKCLMDLLLKTSDTLPEMILRPVNSSVLSTIKTVKPLFQKMSTDVEAEGYIDYDSRTEHNISSLYSGRIEKLYIRYPYQRVRKGEKVFELYSPELVTAQENLLFIMQNDTGETGLLHAAKEKLKFLGVTDDLLGEIVKTQKVWQVIPVYSPFEGHVHSVVNTSSGQMNSMNQQTPKNRESAGELPVKEGMYVMMGETVFSIFDAQQAAVILQIRHEDMSKVKTGADVEMQITDYAAPRMHGKINFIEPALRAGFKTVSAKVYVDNSKYNQKIGSLVKAKISGKEMEALWVPLSAFVDLGKEKIVWIKMDGHFIAGKVETGVVSNSMIEISDGLTEEDEIALEAHYLTDSDGFVREK